MQLIFLHAFLHGMIAQNTSRTPLTSSHGTTFEENLIAAIFPYPTAHMRWGLAGTANTITFLHIDSDGYSTFVRAITGKKVWGILREDPKLPLSSIDFFLDENFLLDEILDNSTFGLEAIVLRPGDIL